MMNFTDWLEERLEEQYIGFYNKRYVMIPIIKNKNDKDDINEVLKYLKIIIDQGIVKVNVSSRIENRDFLKLINVVDKNQPFLLNRFVAYVLKSLIYSDFKEMSIENSSVAYVFKIKDCDSRLNINTNSNKDLYIKFSFVYKVRQKDKKLMKLLNDVSNFRKGITISPNNYEYIFIDTEHTLIDVVSIHLDY